MIPVSPRTRAFPWILALCLALMNIGLVAYLWVRPAADPGGPGGPGEPHDPRRPHGHHAPPRPIPEILQFDDAQRKSLKALQDDHFSNDEPYRQRMHAARDTLFGLLRGGHPDPAEVDRRLDTFAHRVREMETRVFRHFSQIRALCTPAQQEIFDNNLPELIRRPPPGKRP